MLNRRLLEITCVLVIAYLAFQILTFSYGRDQGIYAMVGRAITHGQMPYRDAWDFKPPGIFLVYALSRGLFGSAQWGIRMLEIIGLGAMVYAMAELTRRWWSNPRIGLVGGVVAALVHAQLDFWHTAQPETFAGMLTIFALLALGDAGFPASSAARQGLSAKREIRAWVISGALFGLCGLMKPPLAGGGAVVAGLLSLRAYREANTQKLKKAARPALAILAGGALPFVLCLIWFAAKGALGDLYVTLFVFTPKYTALSWVGETVGGMVYWGFTEWLSAYCSVTTVGVALAAALQPKKDEREGVVAVLGIIAIHLVGVILQGKFFPYHYGATWPLTGLLAGIGFIRIWERLERLPIAGFAIFTALAAATALGRSATKDTEESFRERCDKREHLFLGRGPRDQLAIDKLASVADVNAAANREVARYVAERVPKDKPIFVWGFEPVIYDLADRDPATRYIYDVPQRVAWVKEAARAALMRDLTAHPPAAIIVERRDVFPMVTGDAIDSADTLAGFPQLRDLIAGYEHAATIEDFEIFLAR
jgi:hypothetical protein